jgi:DNA-binding MarR family transcriptional regulator
MMSDQTDILTRTLTRLGLSPEEVQIYLHLLEKGSLSALQISRNIHIARTRVYRLLDKLEAAGLVTQKFGDLGLKFTASSHRQLELLLAQRQSELDGLKASMPLIFGQLASLERQGEEGSHIYYHHGIDGLKHVTWNSLRAKGELRIYEVSESMTAFLPQEFSEKVREEFGARKTKILQLTNLTHIKPYTEMLENVKYWTPRYIDPKELSIKTEIMLYNDMTVLYHYLNRDIFCVEIENADQATMQRQIFDYIWSHARSMKKIGEHGEAKISS